MSASADASASYAAEVARLLWPDPWEAPQSHPEPARQRAGPPRRLHLPERTPPATAGPGRPARSSATMLRRLGAGRSALAGPVRSLLERSVRSRAFALARWPMLRVQGDGPGRRLDRALPRGVPRRRRPRRHHPRNPQGQPEAGAPGLPPRRDGPGLREGGAQRPDGRARPTRGDSLAAVGSHLPRSFRLPRLLHHGRWAGLEVLVISPLPARPARR